MTVFRILDQHVVTEAEYRAKRVEISTFLDRRSAGQGQPSLSLSDERFLSAVQPPQDVIAPVADPIGKGSPLSILIREVYTGNHPSSGIFGEGGDIAIVSAVKNYDVFNASSRALNFVIKDAQPHTRLSRPDPFSNGTSLVSYSPAIMTDSLTVGFELAVASFPKELTDSLSAAFNTLAGVPLLLPYSGYLLGAGELFKLVGNIGHVLFDRVKFSVTDAIDFDIFGSPPAVAGFRLISTDDTLSQYTYAPSKGLVDAAGNAYQGDSPYVVISLDGKQRDNLKSFSPSVASSAILERFFSVQDGSKVSIDSIVEGLQFISDSKYREKALAAKAKLNDVAATAAAKTQAQQDYAAAVANILNDAMKP